MQIDIVVSIHYFLFHKQRFYFVFFLYKNWLCHTVEKDDIILYYVYSIIFLTYESKFISTD